MAVSTNRRLAALAWHSIALASCAYGFKSLHVLHELLGVPMFDEYGGFMQFLTMCGLTATTAAMSLAFLINVIQVPEALFWLKDFVTAAALPAETLITVLYWSIVAINKDLVMQPKKVMDPANPGQVLREEPIAIPFSIDASMHAFPGVFLLVDFFIFSRRFPKSISMVAVAAGVTITYSLWAERCAEKNGHYPYPLLDILSTPQRIALYGGAGTAACLVGYVLPRLQAKVQGTLSAASSKKTS
ncbi:hypothetical protein EX895_002435 [Sporisorium graminicola]|uniref:Uncharacterized protein n=1 Tax=Sporisorium graminicola TaxID=280036 RepID=A0A4U7KVS6_9BASI|nr:hypothetical protein EX895_002435 [Sporisorium graminicola]TKY88804.1 hypothetical protein EX895_002435 [Sporisorium graminicola]